MCTTRGERPVPEGMCGEHIERTDGLTHTAIISQPGQSIGQSAAHQRNAI